MTYIYIIICRDIYMHEGFIPHPMPPPPRPRPCGRFPPLDTKAAEKEGDAKKQPVQEAPETAEKINGKEKRAASTNFDKFRFFYLL